MIDVVSGPFAAIGYFSERKTDQLAMGESPVKLVPVYETRTRKGHTQVKVFRGEMIWIQLPIEADPQHTKNASLVLFKSA